MATVTHYIYSNYDPEDRETIEEQMNQHTEEDLASDEVWQKEAPRPLNRLRAPPPQFVPATISYDGWSSAQENMTDFHERPNESLGNNLSNWYRSLTTSCSSNTKALCLNSVFSVGPSYPPTNAATREATPPRKKESRNKNPWFIMNAIQSEPSSSVSTPAPSLAEILARDPPPLPSEGKYAPPVWLEIGPSNKGFGLLQLSGWNEGEALGPDVVRRKPIKAILPDDDIIPTTTYVKGKGKAVRKNPSSTLTRQEILEVKVENLDDVSELRRVDVIDLTLSDSSDSDSNLDDPLAEDGNLKREDASPPGELEPPQSHMQPPADDSAYGRKALLTPIATVLKSDRLGIGLKAKTVGPHKASQKRVTHSAAALAAHVKVAEESRRRAKLFGRGKIGFEKQHKREEEKRKAMLAYLKGA